MYCIYTHLLLQTVIITLRLSNSLYPHLLPNSPAAHAIGEMATTFEEGYRISSWTRESALTLSDYHFNCEDYRRGHCRLPNPFASTSSSPFQTRLGDIGSLDDVYPDERDSPFPLPSLNGNLQLTPDSRLQNRKFLSNHLELLTAL